jgi:hypothetical protein
VDVGNLTLQTSRNYHSGREKAMRNRKNDSKLTGGTLLRVLGSMCEAAKFSSREDTVNPQDPTSRTRTSGYVYMDCELEPAPVGVCDGNCGPCSLPRCFQDRSPGLYEVEVTSIWGDDIEITNCETGMTVAEGYWSDGKWWRCKGLPMVKVLNRLILYGTWTDTKPDLYAEDVPCMACGSLNCSGSCCV